VGRSDPLTWSPLLVVGLVVAVLAVVLVGGHRSGGPVAEPRLADPGAAPTATTSPGQGATGKAVEPGPARQGNRAPSQVDRWTPKVLVLPDRTRAPVVPVATVDGELKVPKHVDELGWWDGSAWLGDPFGATVIAGHVDSATEGLGFFAQLLGIEVGQRVRLYGAEGQRQTYQVTSVRTIQQNALADGRTLDQTGDHRLVLITCTGAYTPGAGYESNLVVTAEQVGAEK